MPGVLEYSRNFKYKADEKDQFRKQIFRSGNVNNK